MWRRLPYKEYRWPYTNVSFRWRPTDGTARLWRRKTRIQNSVLYLNEATEKRLLRMPWVQPAWLIKCRQPAALGSCVRAAVIWGRMDPPSTGNGAAAVMISNLGIILRKSFWMPALQQKTFKHKLIYTTTEPVDWPLPIMSARNVNVTVCLVAVKWKLAGNLRQTSGKSVPYWKGNSTRHERLSFTIQQQKH